MMPDEQCQLDYEYLLETNVEVVSLVAHGSVDLVYCHRPLTHDLVADSEFLCTQRLICVSGLTKQEPVTVYDRSLVSVPPGGI